MEVAHPAQVLLRAVELEALLPNLDRGIHAPHAQRNVALLLVDPRERLRIVGAADVAGRLVVLEGLGVRVQHRGGVARGLEEVDRLLVNRLEVALCRTRLLRQVGRAAVVLGEHRDHLVGAVSHAVLEEAADLEVLGAAHRLGEHPVGDVADQHVLEGVLPLAGELAAGGLDDEVLFLKRHERVVQVEAGVARHPGERTLPERPADDRCLLQELPLARFERVQPRREQRLDRAGQLGRLDGPLLGQHPRHLLGEEWVAAGARGDHVGRPLCVRAAGQQRGDELARLVGAERVQEDRRRSAASTAPRRPVLKELVAREAEQEERPAHPLREVLDQVEHAVVGPVDVLESQDKRLLLAAGLHRCAHRREERLAQLLGVLLLDGHFVGDLDAEQAGHERRPPLDGLPLALVGQQEAARVVLDLLPSLIRAVPVEDARVGADHLAEGPVDDAGAVGEAAALAEGGGLLGQLLDALAELVEQAGLADARLADEGDQVRPPLAGHPAVEGLHERELVVAPHERRCCAGSALLLRGEGANGLPRGHGRRLPLQVQRRRAPLLDHIPGRAVGTFADRHRAGPAGGLEPRGHVHGVADDGVAVAHGTGKHLAGVGPDPQLEACAVPGGQLGVDLLHRALHAERSTDGALLVVLMCDRCAEDGHDVVADVLVHRPAVARGPLASRRSDTLDQALDALGVHVLGHGGVAGEVGEQHRYLAALVGRRGGRGRGKALRPVSGPERPGRARSRTTCRTSPPEARVCRRKDRGARAARRTTCRTSPLRD